jgi:hypothetical protein
MESLVISLDAVWTQVRRELDKFLDLLEGEGNI